MKEPDKKQVVDEERQESREQQSDRNWNELLQELRVMQTGTQILVAFLFTIPFQPKFGDLDDLQRGSYIVLVVFGVVMTILLLAPISLHRSLFRQRLKREIVERSALLVRMALLGTALLAAGGAALVVDVALNRIAGVTVLVLLLGVAALLWLGIPAVVEHRKGGSLPRNQSVSPHKTGR